MESYNGVIPVILSNTENTQSTTGSQNIFPNDEPITTNLPPEGHLLMKFRTNKLFFFLNSINFLVKDYSIKYRDWKTQSVLSWEG